MNETDRNSSTRATQLAKANALMAQLVARVQGATMALTHMMQSLYAASGFTEPDSESGDWSTPEFDILLHAIEDLMTKVPDFNKNECKKHLDDLIAATERGDKNAAAAAGSAYAQCLHHPQPAKVSAG